MISSFSLIHQVKENLQDHSYVIFLCRLGVLPREARHNVENQPALEFTVKSTRVERNAAPTVWIWCFKFIILYGVCSCTSGNVQNIGGCSLHWRIS